MSEIPAPMQAKRRRLSQRHLVGEGVEIGALHHPIELSRRARVRYVDRMDATALRAHYSELADYEFVPVDIIDDGERLDTLPDESLDFLVANHFLEHAENPLGTMRRHLSKLRPGGTLFYGVPNKDFSFDRPRPLTTFEHLARDDAAGPEVSRSEHFREWTRVIERVDGAEAVEARARLLESIGYSIHFHVWDAASFADFLDRACEHLEGSFEIREFSLNDMELIAVLGRTETDAIVEPSRSRRRASRPMLNLASRLGHLRARLVAR
ncbi:class I SAM-dependent methyltransferase [Paludisphaera rhizosphaerae]|uniref:class I SAM-dependent methyltransferase n=1 Tax=Paludisphaera rhizosphaerae TaxID=2711216 RepID=UPI0013EB9DCC|nr:class I SAM-dependent methyltransferase [Paludisphaera rhizosphaerae]